MAVDYCGVGRKKITPKRSLELAGFQDRRLPFIGVLDDLWVRALCLQDDNQQVYIVNGDLLWFSRDLCQDVRELAAKKWDIIPESILFNATHTHAAPQLWKQAKVLGRIDDAYFQFVRNQLLDAINQARSNMEACLLYKGYIHLPSLFINRRDNFSYHSVDDELYYLKVVNKSGSRNLAWVLNMACHPVYIRKRWISADLPGALERNFTKRYPGTSLFFLQGACANIIPSNARKGKLIRGIEKLFGILPNKWQKYNDINIIKMSTVAKRIERLVYKDSLNRHWRVKLELKARLIEINLPLENSRFGNLSPKKSICFLIQKISLNRNLILIALEGEPFVETVLKYKKLYGSDKDILVVGYSNGMVGYLPPKSAFLTGGYEVYDVPNYLGQAAPFKDTLESIMDDAINNLMIETII